MFINEEVLNYILQFVSRYEIQTRTHVDAVKQLRTISDELIEKLYKPAHINVIRKAKKD